MFAFVYSILVGSLMLSEEEEKAWMQYWRELPWVGLVQKEYKERSKMKVQEDLERARQNLEDNAIR